MVSQIEISLNRLNEAVALMETAVTRRAQERKAEKGKKKSAQPDLFSAPPVAANAAPRNVVNIDPVMLARKLDGTIEKMEQILRGGR